MESTATARLLALAGLAALTLTGCPIRVPKPEVPAPEVIVVNCLEDLELEPWVFEKLPTPYLEEVRALGGTNEALLRVFHKQKLLLDSGNQRLTHLGQIIDDAIKRCRQSPP